VEVKDWNEGAIEGRAARLAETALSVWEFPKLDSGAEKETSSGAFPADASVEYNIMNRYKFTYCKPKTYRIGDHKKEIVKSWKDIFQKVLQYMYNLDNNKFNNMKNTSEMKELFQNFMKPHDKKSIREIYPGCCVKTNFSANDIMNYLKTAVRIFCLKEDIFVTDKEK
jgi:hypothetical protein